MIEEKPLYEDNELRVDFLHSPEICSQFHFHALEDHELIVKPDGNYIIQRGILNEAVLHANRKRLGEILDQIHPFLRDDLTKHGLTYDSVGVALHCAYQESERRIEDYVKKILI